MGVRFHESPFSSNFIRIETGLAKIISSNLHANGDIFIQDRASGAVVELLDPNEGDIVLDVCAAQGQNQFTSTRKLKNQEPFTVRILMNLKSLYLKNAAAILTSNSVEYQRCNQR